MMNQGYNAFFIEAASTGELSGAIGAEGGGAAAEMNGAEGTPAADGPLRFIVRGSRGFTERRGRRTNQ